MLVLSAIFALHVFVNIVTSILYISFKEVRVKVLVVQSCPPLCHPMVCSPPRSFVLGILQGKIPERVAICFPGLLFQPRHQFGSPALQANALPTEPPVKPPNYHLMPLWRSHEVCCSSC